MKIIDNDDWPDHTPDVPRRTHVRRAESVMAEMEKALAELVTQTFADGGGRGEPGQ